MVFLILAAVISFTMLKVAANGIAKARREDRAPSGYAGAMEWFVVWVRNEMAIANIGKEMGPRYAPLIMAFFFFILTTNLLGLMPWGASPSGNLAVTGALAVLCLPGDRDRRNGKARLQGLHGHDLPPHRGAARSPVRWR